MALPSDSVPPSEPDRPAPGPEPGHPQRSKKDPDDTSDLAAGLASRISPRRPGPPSSQRSTPKPSQVKPDPPAPVGASAGSPNPVTRFLLYFLVGALFGPFLAISFGAGSGQLFLITSIACGLLSAIGGKRFWQFLSRCLRVIFFMR